MALYFKNTEKDIVMTEKDEEDYRKYNNCRFCEKNIESDKVGDHCHLTCNYRGPAHSKCNIKVIQHQSIFMPFIFHNFSNYDCHLFFKKLVKKRNDKVKLKIMPKTNEEYISLKNECIRFIDSYQFLSSSLDSLVKTLVDNSQKTLKDLKEEIVDKDELLNILNEIRILITKDTYKNDSIKDSKKDYPDEIEKLEEALPRYMGKLNLKF